VTSGLAGNENEARTRLQRVLDNGEAAERFGRMVAAQGGPNDFVNRYDRYLPAATLSKPVFASQAGFISAMDTRALGLAVVALGGGRRRVSDAIDYSVGLTGMVRLGEPVQIGQPLATIHAASEDSWIQAAQAVRASITIAAQAPAVQPVIYRRITTGE